MSVTVSGEGLNKDFILGNISASVNIKVTASDKNIVSDYVKFIPACSELKFVRYLLQNFDTDNDGIVELDALANVKEINISGMNIATLDGVVDKMIGLEKLDCSNNQLKNLNLSNNSNLTELFCNNNMLTSLDCTTNEYLYTIDFSKNDGLSEVKQAGLLIDDVRWSILNVGAHSTTELGDTGYSWQQCMIRCPSGWRLPNESEMKKIIANHSLEVVYRGAYGVWFSGGSKFSYNLTSLIFFPYTDTRSNIMKGYYYYDSKSQKGGMFEFGRNGKPNTYLQNVRESYSSDDYLSRDFFSRCVKD